MSSIVIYHLNKEFDSENLQQAGVDGKKTKISHGHPHATEIISSLSGSRDTQLTDKINANIKILEHCSRLLLDNIEEASPNLGMIEMVKKEARDDCDLRMVLLQKLANITINEK